MKSKKMLYSILLVLTFILDAFSPLTSFLLPVLQVSAADISGGEVSAIVYAGDTISTSVINYDGRSIGPGAYIIMNGVEYPAFCVDPNLPGAEGHPNRQYQIDITGTNMSPMVATVLHNSIPYVSKDDILSRYPGLSDLQIYAATKAAIRAVSVQSASRYPDDDLWYGDPQTVAFAKYLISLARNAPEDIPISAIFGIDNKSEVYVEKGFYVRTVTVQSSNYPLAPGAKITFEIPPEAPSGTVITFPDDTPLPADGVSNSTTIKIKIPLSSVPEGTSGSFDIMASTTIFSNVILFGVPTSASEAANYQRYEISMPNQPIYFNVPMEYISVPAEQDPEFGGLQILKYDNVTGSLTPGAVFEIRGLDDNNKAIMFQVQASSDAVVPLLDNGAEVKTGNGVVTVSGIPAGKYLITEISPPLNYDVSPDGVYSQIAEVQSDTVTTVYPQIMFRNNPYGSLRITKVDAVTGLPVAGVTLRIRNEIAGIDVTRTTDGIGVITITDLPQGNYSITETNAGADYELNPSTLIVPVRWGQTAEAVFDNQPHTSFEVTKINSKTNQPVTGAVFTLKHLATGKEWTLTTLTGGKAIANNIPTGNYALKEIYVPEPLILNSTVINIQIDNDKVNSYTAVNDEKPIVTIEKYDEKTSQILPGAEFRLERIDSGWQTEFMNVTGTHTLTVAPGTYRLTEIAAPWGYLISTEEKVFVLNPNDEITIKFDNRERPALEIVKIDEATGRPLAGARFRITETEGLTVSEYVTDATGRIYIENLNDVIYSVEEITAPDGYLLETQHKDVKLEWGITKTLIFTNKARPALEILKTDEATGRPLAGAKFRVWAAESDTVNEYTTDASGRILITDLNDVIYSVEEITAPDGYLLETQHKDIQLECGKTKTLVFTNKERPKLEILKIDTITGQYLAGARFKVTKTEDLTVSEFVTGADGRIFIDNLDEAVYTVEEITAPEGYILDPQKKEIQLELGKTKTLIYEDTRKPTLIITKTNALTFEPIPNTTYRIEYEDLSGGVHTLGTYRTDANGQIILPNVKSGWYIITETQAAPGYSLAANPVTRKYLAPGENAYTNFNVSGTGGDTSGTNIRAMSGSDFLLGQEILDYPLNSIVIRKVNAVTGEMLSGARFQVRRVTEETSGSSGTIIGEYTTDNSGVIVITGLIPGGYIIEEIKAPANYLISENSQQQLWLKYDGTSIVEATFANVPYGAILITKTDSQTGKPLANARFHVTDSSGAVVGNTNGEFITDENGEILIPNIKPGSYVITEIEAPANYVIDTTPQTVNVGLDGKIYKVSFKNQPYGGILVTKTDVLTGKPLANARFRVTDSSGAVVGTSNGIFVTDENGEILIPNVKPGSYVITEIEAPEYYAIDTTPQTVYVNADGRIYSVSFKNQPTGTLVIRKLDSVTKEPLADAQFKVTTSGGDVVGTSNGIFKTDATGTITIPHLDKESYVIQEIKAPDDYILENQSQTITIDYGKTYSLDFYNKKMSGLQIIKIDSQSKQPLKGAEFAVYKQSGELTGRYTTDADGLIIIDTLSPGWYKIVETKTLDGYILDETPKDVLITDNQFVKVVFENAPMSSLIIRKVDADTRDPLEGAEFTVKTASGTLIGIYRSGTDGMVSIPKIAPGWYTITETKSPDGYTLGDNVQTVEITNTKTVTVEFQNRAFGSLVIKKIDAVTGDPLTGAEFSVYHQGGAFVGEYATAKDGTINIPNVAPGWYVISETKAPAGYTLDSTAKTVEVKPVVPSVVTFTNKPLSGIEIIKTDSVTHNPLANATFTVEKANGEKIGTHKTNAAGEIIIPNLPEGVYIVSETIAPIGYVLNETPKTVVVVSGKLTTVEFTNDPYGSLIIKKIDEITGNPLSGAKFTVSHQGGTVIGEYITGIDGSVTVPNIAPGWYVVSETKAPANYHLNSTAKTIEVKSYIPTTVTFANRPYSVIEIIKTDSVTGVPLMGAVFTIQRTNGERVGDKYTTDISGKIIVPDLPEGFYIISEIQAPAEYVLDAQPQTVEVKSGKLTVAEFTNTPYPYIHIVKTDASTGQLLSGAEFIVTNSKGEVIANVISQASGAVSIKVEPGVYTVTEIKAPAGYENNDPVQTVEVRVNGSAVYYGTSIAYPNNSATFANRPLNAIQILKLDSITHNPLSKALFTVEKSDGTRIGSFLTDSAGSVLISGLTEGTYVIKEISAPAGYQLDETPKTINISGGRIVDVDFLNKPLSGIQITKLDAITQKPLKDASFTVTRPNGEKIGTFRTGADGMVVVPDLNEGTYIISEIFAPTGYQLDETPKSVNVVSGRLATVEFMNRPYSGLEITKIDAVTKVPLQGASFEITRADGVKIGIYKTDAAGKILVNDLPEGTYIISETIAPNGYMLNETPKTVNVVSGRLAFVEFSNAPYGSLIIKKTDEITGRPLSGANFTVKHQNGRAIGDFITDNDGSIVIPNLEPDWYVVSETKSPNGYHLDSTAKTIEVTSHTPTAITFTNRPYSGIEIIKTDAVTHAPLAGATFVIEHANGEKIGTYKTDVSGKIIVPDLPEGTYIVSETIAPDGYVLDEIPKTVNVKSGKLTSVEFQNQPYGNLVIKKVDEITGSPLSGAVFNVTHINGEYLGEFTTGKDGAVTIPGLKQGWYKITETKAPFGYMINETAQTVEVKSYTPTVVTISNAPMSGIEIIKLDAVSRIPLYGATFTVEKVNGEKIGTYRTDISGKILVPYLADGVYIISEIAAPFGYVRDEAPKTVTVNSGKLTTVEFLNKALSGIEIIKLDAQTNAPLSGATFVVEKTNGERIGTYKTDWTGKVIVYGLSDGTYIISETIAPYGYILDEAPKTVEVKSGRLTVVEFFNKPLASLRIIKLNSATRMPVEGVEFVITKMSGERIQNDFRGYNFKTDRTGQIYIPNLEDGYYIVTEVTTADGYFLDGEPKTVLLQSGKTTVLEVLNTPMSGLLIVKTDEKTGRPLGGVVFDIRRADGQFVTGNILDANQPNTEVNSPNKTTSSNGDVPGSFTTDSNGRILINGLPAGEYHITERRALDGYELDTNVYSVTVTPGKLAALQLTNRQKAGLRLVKIDSFSKKPIYNVEFMVFDSNNKIVGTYYTDNNGIIELSGILTQGRYTIRETRAAMGYYRDDVPRTVEFVSGQITEIRWENTPCMGQIQITKRSADDNEVNSLSAGTPLANAVFEIYEYKSGNLVDRIVSGADGRAVSIPLPLGRYTVKEIQAPQWYKLSEKTLDIEIEFAGQIIKTEFLNYSANTGVYIKKTGAAECMPGDTIRYDIKAVQNTGTVPLTDFYWRDILSTDAVRLNKIVTGTYNQSLKYKIMVTTNKGDSRIIADNLSTTKNNVIDCSNTALGLRSDEYVTSFTLIFGTVKAGFSQVEQPQIYVDVLSTLQNGYQFANKCDVGGKYGSEWIVGVSTLVTKVYRKPEPLPRTGY